ncbi:hypothetical protein [Streptomyces fagopyri]|uniref:hypothetical protein n=1 Tax=Streptomyces fagopyri TaxID=2662397 RepID=UPI003403E955
MNPIHEVERQFINEHGLESFWKSGWVPTDVLRRPTVWSGKGNRSNPHDPLVDDLR